MRELAPVAPPDPLDAPGARRHEPIGDQPAPPDETLEALVAVLDAVRLGRARSRPELTARTGYGRGVVAQRVGELVDRGLLVEGDPGPSTGGRPPRQLSFRGDAGHLLVADLGATSVDVAVTTLDGRILAHRAEPADVAADPEVSLRRVDELFGQVREREGVPGALWGIGIGLPSPVEFRTGRPILPAIMPAWDGYPVRTRFATRYDAPVWVDNDANVLALGEWRSGIAAGHQHVVVVKMGTGIGAGIISNGRLHRGAQGSAGDVGHTQVSDDPAVVCRCGNRGCLEALAGGVAIARAGEAAAADGSSPGLAAILRGAGTLTAADVASAAAEGDPTAMAILRTAGERVGAMLAGVVDFFDPSLIVVGGGVARSGAPLLAAIEETVRRRSLPLATRDLEVRRSSLGDLAGVIGASAMVVDQLLAPAVIGRWIGAGSPAGRPEVAEPAAI